MTSPRPERNSPLGIIGRTSLAAMCLLFGALTIWSFFAVPQVLDDAFITYRMAQNLADGQGPYFNPGERVQACTTPLYMILLAGGRRLSGLPVDRFEIIVEAFTLAALLVLLWWMGATVLRSRAWGLLPPLILLIQPEELHQVKGMEALLFATLILGAWRADFHRRGFLCGILIGLVAATRTEGGIIIAAWVAAWLIGRHVYGKEQFSMRDAGWRAAGALAAGLPFLVFVAAHYDSLIPNSVKAKALLASAGWGSVAKAWRIYLVGSAPWFSCWGVLLLAGALALGPLAARLRLGLRAWRALGFPAVLTLLHGGFFLATRAPMNYHWYSFPEKIALCVFFALLIALLWHVARGRHPDWLFSDDEARRGAPGPAWLRGRALLYLCVAVSYILFYRSVYSFMGYDTVRRFTPRMMKPYPEIGRMMGEKAPREWTFAAAEIGILGYTSGLHCLDLAGIATPECLKYYTKEPLGRIVLRFTPELYVTDSFPELTEGTPEYDPAIAVPFHEKYQKILSRPGPQGETAVFCRKDVAGKIRLE